MSIGLTCPGGVLPSMGYFAETQWLVNGPADDLALAALFWSLRALGGRPRWMVRRSLLRDGAPPESLRARQVAVVAPRANRYELQAACTRWSTARQRFFHDLAE